MAKTILQIAQEAAERDNTAPPPTSLFSSNTKVAKLLRVAAKDTIRDILSRSGHTGLSDFHSLWLIGLVPGRHSYPLPPDFLRMIPNTEHRGGWPLGLVGPASPQAWANWIFGGAVGSVEMGWRIRNGVIIFDPTPSTAELVTIEYVSRWPVVGALSPDDYDFSQTPPRFVSPFVPRDVFANVPDHEAVLAKRATYDAPGLDTMPFSADLFDVAKLVHPLSRVAPLPQVRRPEFTADTDMTALGDDFLLSLGMTYRLRRSLGMDYAEIVAEYEMGLEQMIAHDAGGARSVALGRCDDAAQVVPLGGGKWMVS